MTDLPFPPLPHRVEPGQVSIAELHAELYPDCKKVRVTVLTAGAGHRPSLDFKIMDASGSEIARSVIVENYDQKTEFTMHLLRPNFVQPLSLTCKAYFENNDFSAENSVLITGS